MIKEKYYALVEINNFIRAIKEYQKTISPGMAAHLEIAIARLKEARIRLILS